jgi:hypothetical protein
MFFERFDYKECQGELVEPGAIYNKVCACVTRLRQAQADNSKF